MKPAYGAAIFIDANVLLEAVLQGRKYATNAQSLLAAQQVVISPLTAHLFTYFGQKDGLDLNVLLDLLAKHQFTELGRKEIDWAILNHQDDDFEDALQVSCAVSHGAQKFVTLDRKLAESYQSYIKMELLS